MGEHLAQRVEFSLAHTSTPVSKNTGSRSATGQTLLADRHALTTRPLGLAFFGKGSCTFDRILAGKDRLC